MARNPHNCRRPTPELSARSRWAPSSGEADVKVAEPDLILVFIGGSCQEFFDNCKDYSEYLQKLVCFDEPVGSAVVSRAPSTWWFEATLLSMEVRSLDRKEAVERLVALEPDIRALGVHRLALFGSVLRNEAGPDSDVDILVWFKPGRKTFDSFLELAELLESHLGHRVELVTRESLSPFLGPQIMAEAADVIRSD